MSKAFKAASSLGAVALVLSGAAMASPPVAFDQWSVSSGDITIDLGAGATCPATWTCSNAITGDGFFQRQISDGSNDYFQTIITDKGISGSPGSLSFSDESYVRSGNVSGLADKSSITSSSVTGTLTENFDASTELLTGWANNGSGDEVKIYQGISADDSAAEDFRTDFWLAQLGASGVNGKLMRITSAVDIEESSNSTQDFVLVDRSGSSYVNADSVDIDGDASPDLTWASGQNVKAIWVGQDMSSMDQVFQEFGFTSYENITTSELVNTFSLAPGAASAPVDWDTSNPPAGWGSLATDGTGGPF